MPKPNLSTEYWPGLCTRTGQNHTMSRGCVVISRAAVLCKMGRRCFARARLAVHGMLLAVLLLAPEGPAFAAADQGLLDIRTLDRKLAEISFRLATQNTALCPVQQAWSGLVLHDLNQYAPAYRRAAVATFRLEGGYPAVLAIVPGSPADAADLSEDESIAAIDGIALIPAVFTRRPSNRSIDETGRKLDAALQTGRVQLVIRSGRGTRTVALDSIPGCMSRVELAPGPQLTAAADGRTIQVTGALAQFVRSDDELAIVAGHEMAHNILRHREKLDAAKVERGLLGSIGNNAARIYGTEREADYLGLYLAARAGYDISAAIGFWERYGRRNGWGIFRSATHPGWRKRQEMVHATIHEIANQKATDHALIPDYSRLGR